MRAAVLVGLPLLLAAMPGPTVAQPAPAGAVVAPTAADQHAAAVRQLRQDGHQGLDRALGEFEGLMRREPGFLQAYLSAADAYVLKHEFAARKERAWLEAAARHLDAVLARDPALAPAYYKRAVVRFGLGAPDPALADLGRAMELVPTYLDPRLLYLQHLLAAKRTDEAWAFARMSARLFPGDPAPLRYMGDLFFHAGADVPAVDLYRAVVQLVPQAPHTWLALGKASQRLGRHADAADALRRALAQDASLAEARFDLARSLTELGQAREAVDQLRTYLAQAPDDVAALNNLALLHEQLGQPDEARATWLRVSVVAKPGGHRERAARHLQRLASGSAAGPPAVAEGAQRVNALMRAEKATESAEPADVGDPPPGDHSVQRHFEQARQERLQQEAKEAEAEIQTVTAERQVAAQEAQRRQARQRELQGQAAKWQDEMDKQATASAQAWAAWDREHSFGAYAKRFLGVIIQTSVGAFTGGLLGTLGGNLADRAVNALFPDARPGRPGYGGPGRGVAGNALAAGTSAAITSTATAVGQTAGSLATGSLTQGPGTTPRY